MKTLVDQLAQYGAYHRDTRNLVTHVIGIPMIVLAVVTLLGRPAFALGPVVVSPGFVASVAATVFYLALDLRFGIVMGLVLAVLVAIGQWFAAMPTLTWLAWGTGLFVVGWVFQFVGHGYEGKKPAFVDDVIGLAVGPLFVAAELAFAMGLRKEVERDVEARIGPMHGGKPREAST